MKRSQAPGHSVAIRRASTRQWVLKPQDLAVAFKLVTLAGKQVSYAALSQQLKLSPFEVHAAVQRLRLARLVVDREKGMVRPNMAALRAFVIHGAPYSYPPVKGEATIGFPTAHAAPPIKGRVQTSKSAGPVWPHPQGSTRGEALLPLYEKLPLAAIEDAPFYELLSLFDALRSGQAREREMARRFLEDRLQ